MKNEKYFFKTILHLNSILIKKSKENIQWNELHNENILYKWNVEV